MDRDTENSPTAHSSGDATSLLAALPPVDRLLRLPEGEALIAQCGRELATEAARASIDAARQSIMTTGEKARPQIGDAALAVQMAAYVAVQMDPSLKSVFNLTGTVIHTNLGRAVLPQEALDAISRIATTASNLEFDLESGMRGDRDTHLEAQICKLTGAEAATVVNNNAAAVLLLLNSLARRKEVLVSRGELIEIGGSFRIPDIMRSAGCKLREVGTTNRTHARDFEQALSPQSALVMKIHTSNYEIQGFTAAVAESELARIAKEADVPFAVDLGSGTLADTRALGLPHEPTPGETLAQGADLVTFSGDKLLGGPQAGVIAGRADLIVRIKKNPMRRALRVDKITIAALSAVLRLYANPDRLAERVPVLRSLTRSLQEIEALAHRVQPDLAKAVAGVAKVQIVACKSQIGSGSLPVEALDSWALALQVAGPQRQAGGKLKRLAAVFRALPTPVIGRIADQKLLFDVRCLEDEAGLLAQLVNLDLTVVSGSGDRS